MPWLPLAQSRDRINVTTCAFLIPGDIDLPTGGYAYDRRVLALLGEAGVRTRHVKLPGSFPSPTAVDLRATGEIVASLADCRVVLADGLAFGAMPTDLIRRIPQPIVALCHHPLCLEAGLTVARTAELRTSESAALALARAVVVTSPMTAALLARDFGVPPASIHVAEPGTDPAPQATGTGAPLQLLAVGSVVPRKGYDVLVRALERIAALDWQLTIAGAADRSPGTAAALRAQIAVTGLGSRIRLTGAVDDVTLAGLYGAADLFVMPSLFEGYGMVLAEAMARGLPIVCTTGGAAAETAPDAAALKVAPGEVGTLAVALENTIVDGGLRRRMAEASWSAGKNLPRWPNTARIIADVLRKVAR